LIVGGSLIVTTGIGWLFLREVLNPWQVVAVLSIIAGVVVLAWQAGR
jgi:transporter family protein